VNVLFCASSMVSIYLFWIFSGMSPVLDAALIFFIGFFIFGPQMLIGVAAAELSHKRAAATATGFIGWIASLGCATAGYPLGYLITQFGWEAFFIVLMSCAFLSTALLIPLWNTRTREETALA
jgi:MFS transporter, OPA family, sugar phosphate sensor protein UhpC